jgi:hypothetical protein
LVSQGNFQEIHPGKVRIKKKARQIIKVPLKVDDFTVFMPIVEFNLFKKAVSEKNSNWLAGYSELVMLTQPLILTEWENSNGKAQ